MIAVLPINSAMYEADGKVYGATYNKKAKTWTRTDLAQNFADPVAAIGTGSGSSPFDNIYPWSGIKKVTIDDNVMVDIPKYYLKVINTDDVLTVLISDKKIPGYSVSPAHRDRGDGKGERDHVYVGRYLCNEAYKSIKGKPKLGLKQDGFRDNIKQLGTGYYTYDYYMHLTILYLYIVEYANFHSQRTIGLGLSLSEGPNFALDDASKVVDTGDTDTMTYHTGTVGSSRNANAQVQYRYIEGLWGNAWYYINGMYYVESHEANAKSAEVKNRTVNDYVDIRVQTNPNLYDDVGRFEYNKVSYEYKTLATKINAMRDDILSSSIEIISSDPDDPTFLFPNFSTALEDEIATKSGGDLRPESGDDDGDAKVAKAVQYFYDNYCSKDAGLELFMNGVNSFSVFGELMGGNNSGLGYSGGLFTYYICDHDTMPVNDVADRLVYLP